MSWPSYLRELLGALFRKRRVEAELDEEFRFHLEMEVAKNVRAGMSPQEARRMALLHFGGMEQVKEQVRDERGSRPLEDLWMDLRYALRQVRKSPGFAVVAILTLALGIGANAAVFSVLQHVVLAPLPYDQPDRLVRIYQTNEVYGQSLWVSGPAFLDYRDKLDGIESATALYNYHELGFTLTGSGPPRRVRMQPVSSDYFDVYRAEPIIGRRFYRDEERASARVAVLSHRLWQAISGAPDIVGRHLMLDGDPYEVIGVMPAEFVDEVGGDVDLWVPLELQDQNATANWGNHYLSVVARLRPGISREQAQAQLGALSLAQAELQPRQADWGGRVVALQDNLVGDVSGTLYLLFGAAALVLLIACVNVAGLFLARNVARERELALRASIGAKRSRLARQLLTESLVIAFAGGLAGLTLAWWGIKVLPPLIPGTLPRLHEVAVDPTLLAFAAAATLLTLLVFGLAPAVPFADPKLEAPLRENSRTSTGGARARRIRDALVTGQVGLAVLLLVAAGLFMRSMLALEGVHLGIEARDVVTFEVHLGGPRYAEPESRIAFHRQFEDRLRDQSGVRAVGAVSKLPVSDVYHSWTYTYVAADGEVMVHGAEANFRVVEGEYFGVLGIDLVKGRFFETPDDADAPGVAIVNRSVARTLYAGREPLGQRINADGRDWTIVGVVKDVAYDHRGSVTPKVYLPHAQFGDNRNWSLVQLVSTDIPRDDMVRIARRELAAIDPNLVIHNARSMRDVTGAAMARERFSFMLLGLFAAVALSLAVVGIYGVMAYNVGRRAREFGIRQAMGASPRVVRLLVFRHSAAVVGLGVVAGLVGALALSRVVRSMLFQVSATDPLTFLAVALALALAAIVAAYVPARRATRVDPVETLRYE